MSEDRNKQTQYPSEESSDSSSAEELTDNKCDDDESEASYDEVNEDTDSEESTDNDEAPVEESSSYNSAEFDDNDDGDDDKSSFSNDSDSGEFVHKAIDPHHTGQRNKGVVNREETSQYSLNMKRYDLDESAEDSASEESDSDSEKKPIITIDVGTNTEVVKGKLTMSKVEIEEFFEVKKEESVEGCDEILEADNLQGTMYAFSFQNNRTNKEAVMSQSKSVFYSESTQTDLVDRGPSGHHPVTCIQSEKNVDNIGESQLSKYFEKTTQTDALPRNPLNQYSQNTQTDGFLYIMTKSTSEGTTQKNLSPLVSATEQSDITTSEITEQIVDDIIDCHVSKYSQKTTQTDAFLCNSVIQYSQETQTDGLLFDMTESSSEEVTVPDLSPQFLATGYPDMTTSEITKTDSSPRISTSQNPDMTTSENTKPDSSPQVSATQHPNKTISTQPETLLTLIENLVQEEEGTEDEAKTNEKYLDVSIKTETASAESIQIHLEKGIPCNKFINSKVIEMDVKIREERIPHKLKRASNKSLQRNIGNLNDSTKEKRQDPILLKKTKRKTRLCSAYNLLSRDMVTVRHFFQSHKISKGQGTAVSQAQYRMLYHYRWPQLPATRF